MNCKTCGKPLGDRNTSGFCSAHYSQAVRSSPYSRRARQRAAREHEGRLSVAASRMLDEGIADARAGRVRPFDLDDEILTDEEILIAQARPSDATAEAIDALVRFTRKGDVPFEELCDRLDVSPKRLRELIATAKTQNLVVDIDGSKVGFKARPIESVQNLEVKPALPGVHTIGCISDTHLGSKYVLREYLKDFVHHAYAKGARKILHSGDILDGDYKHGKFEMTHMGLDEQMRDLFETLPVLPGLDYFAISGNHDHTFTAEVGVDVPRAIESYFKTRGRLDFHALGNRGATVKVEGALVHLWHPGGSVGYATSYKMQKKIEGFAPGFKPHILQIGHWHRMASIDTRGVFAFAAGTFQGGGSEFANSLAEGPSAIGGTVLSWTLTEDGTLRDIIYAPRRYFEKELPQELR